MEPVVPAPLDLGTRPRIRVVAPSLSAGVVPAEVGAAATRRLEQLGFEVTFGRNVAADGLFSTAPAEARLADLHEAFADPSVALVLTSIGGHSANGLLPGVDWELIARNPKWFCGFSDITVLQNAMLSRSGLVTLYGPHWSTFGCRHFLESTVESFLTAVTSGGGARWRPETWWSDDGRWYLDQEDRTRLPAQGWWPLSPGAAGGHVVGGNLGTLGLLRGTGLLPGLAGAVLFIEDDAGATGPSVARELTALLQQPGSDAIAGVVFGRFQRATGMSRELLQSIVAAQPRLAGLPVIANVDFGHTFPMHTFPVGGAARIEVDATDGAISWELPQSPVRTT